MTETRLQAPQLLDEGNREMAQAVPALSDTSDSGHPDRTVGLHSSAGTACDLTSDEQQVWSLLAQGLDNLGIAERLTVNVLVARALVHQVLTKLGVHSRAEAIALAQQHGVPQPAGPQTGQSLALGTGSRRKEGQRSEKTSEPGALLPLPGSLDGRKENG